MSPKQIKLKAHRSTFTLAAAGALAFGCGGDGSGEDCTVLSARVDVLNDSLGEVQDLAAALRTDVAAACAAIAGEEDVASDLSDSELEQLCRQARLVIETDILAEAQVNIVVVPPVCEVDIQAQVSCEADCYAEANLTCEGGDIRVRCDPGDLSVVCEGTCEVGATCEGSIDVAVVCDAVCNGQCNGACDGECSAEVMNADGEAECAGTCDGTCSGTCNGSCEVTGDAAVECGVDARCKGGCSVEGTGPRCEATLEPPECDAQAQVDCSAACDASGSFEAECTEPSVEVEIDVQSQIATTVEAQLPVLLYAAERGLLTVESVGRLSASIGETSVDVASAGLGCALGLGVRIAAAADAALSASLSVQASFSASVDVAGSVTAGGPEDAG